MIKEAFGTGATLDEAKDAALKALGAPEDADVKYAVGNVVTGKVARIVSIVGAWYGSDVLADLVELKYDENAPEMVYNGLVAELVGEPWGYLVNCVIRIFPKATLRSIIDEILNSLVENLVLKTPSLLGLIPPDRYPAIRESRLANNPDLAYIMEQTDKYYQA